MPTAGKLGKLAPKKVDGLRFIEEYLLKDRLPKAGREVDNSAGITDWGMLGNDTHGDCGPVGYLHVHMADAANFRLKESWPTADQVVREYLAYTGGQDEGVVLADFLSFCQQHSFCGKSLIGYAPAHHDNLAEVRSVIKLFNAAYVGVQLPQIGLDQFERDEEWDLTDTRADDKIAGGHCVVPVEFVPPACEVALLAAVPPEPETPVPVEPVELVPPVPEPVTVLLAPPEPRLPATEVSWAAGLPGSLEHAASSKPSSPKTCIGRVR